MRSVVVLLSVALAACGAPVLTPAGSQVQLMKSDPPQGCKEIGSVSSKGGAAYVGSSDEAAVMDRNKIAMRNNAAEMGANYVRWETVSTGTAYRCTEPSR